jgi:hypothetical protein
MQQQVAAELAHAILEQGQGALCLQTDGVTTARGEVTPFLISYIEPASFTRKLVVAAVGYQPGKSAKDLTAEFRTLFGELGVLKMIQGLLNKSSQSPTSLMQHFKETFNQFVKKLMKNKKMAKEEAMLAALVSYAFGSAVTDGAILGLLEELCGLGVASEDEEMAPVDADVSIDQTSTTWCAPHRWSLTCKVALHRLKLTGQEVQHRSIKPPKRWFAIVMNDMYDVCRDLVNYFDDEENYRMLKEFAKANPITDAATGAILMVRKMYNPSPTRLNAYADQIRVRG